MNGKSVAGVASQVDFTALGSELFWKIFLNNQSAIALTDHAGNVLLDNEPFHRHVVDVPVPVNLAFALQTAHRGNDATYYENDFHFNTGASMVKLSFFRIPENETGATYLWLASTAADATLRHKRSVLKNLYKSFISTSFELIFRTSIDGQLVYANRLFMRSLGYPQYRRLKGISIENFFESRHQFSNLEQRLWKATRIEGETVYFKKADGTRLTGMVNCHLHYDENGAPVFNWTVLDISRQVESEEKLKAKNDELTKVNHQMEKFLYSTSHDLRSPLTSILGLVNLIRMDTGDPKLLDYAAKIEQTTLKLDKVIHDIMDFSRTTYQPIKSERIDFDNEIRRCIAGADTTRIAFNLSIDNGFPFYGDTDRIGVILDNIVRNAFQFHDATKSSPFIKCSVSTQRHAAHITLIDNGVGIGAQHLPHVFTMFYKASQRSQGAGLGLYIVKEALEKMSGTISVESEVGFGTVVRVSIPNDHKGRLIGRKLTLQQPG